MFSIFEGFDDACGTFVSYSRLSFVQVIQRPEIRIRLLGSVSKPYGGFNGPIGEGCPEGVAQERLFPGSERFSLNVFKREEILVKVLIKAMRYILLIDFLDFRCEVQPECFRSLFESIDLEEPTSSMSLSRVSPSGSKSNSSDRLQTYRSWGLNRYCASLTQLMRRVA